MDLIQVLILGDVASDAKTIQDRIAKPASGLTIFNIDPSSEAEMKEKKARGNPTATVERDAARPDRAANGCPRRGGVAGGYGDEGRVDRRKRDGMRCARSAVVGGLRDSLHATRAAVEEGVVAGGGVTLIRTISVLENLKGENADQNIGIQIVRRALEEPLRIIAQNGGWEGSVIVNKVKEGKDAFGFNARTGEYEDLIKAALKNAASIAGLLLTTECLIAEKKESKSGAGAMGGGMGGMGGGMDY